MDSIWIHVSENLSESSRQAEVEIEACHGNSAITVIQSGIITWTDLISEEDIRIYPNPVAGSWLQIVLPESSGTYEYTLTDLTGKALQNGKIHHHRNSIRLDMKSGTYILKLLGNHIQYKKTIIVM